jgi:ferredoxin
MTYVIAEPCIDVKDVTCTEVCPVDCIHPTPDEPGYGDVNQLFIDPDECIDCDACVEVCPVGALHGAERGLLRQRERLAPERHGGRRARR